MEMGDIIRQLRLKHEMTQEELGKVLGVQKSAIRKYESGLVENIPRSSIQKMAELFGVKPSYLMGWEDHEPAKQSDVDLPSNVHPVELKRFPMLGEIACGKPIFADEDHESYVSASAKIKADWCLTAKGDSMTGARINDGDIVFIHEQPMVENGEIAAVIIGDEATLKRWYYYPEKGKLVLNAENPAYEPLVYVGEELNEIRCLGKAVCFMSNL